MTVVAARELFGFIELLNQGFKKATGNKGLSACNFEGDFADAISRVESLSRDASDEIISADFVSEERRDRILERLHEVRRATINGLAKRGAGATSGPLLGDVLIEKLRHVAEQVEEKDLAAPGAATRTDMMRETAELIAEVKEWDLEEYVKNALLMQLHNTEKIIQASDLYSGNELRLRVKGIIADFAAQFVQMDKKHQTQLERIVLWARRGFFVGGAALGLTADLTTIAGMLPAPPRQITGG